MKLSLLYNLLKIRLFVRVPPWNFPGKNEVALLSGIQNPKLCPKVQHLKSTSPELHDSKRPKKSKNKQRVHPYISSNQSHHKTVPLLKENEQPSQNQFFLQGSPLGDCGIQTPTSKLLTPDSNISQSPSPPFQDPTAHKKEIRARVPPCIKTPNQLTFIKPIPLMKLSLLYNLLKIRLFVRVPPWNFPGKNEVALLSGIQNPKLCPKVQHLKSTSPELHDSKAPKNPKTNKGSTLTFLQTNLIIRQFPYLKRMNNLVNFARVPP